MKHFFCTKHSVKDDKCAAVVLVNAIGVAAVMNPVVTWGVQDVLQRSHPIDQLRKQTDDIR